MCAPVRGARGDIEERVDLDVDGGPGAGRCAGETGSQGKDAGDSFVAAADIAANSGVFTMSEQRNAVGLALVARMPLRFGASAVLVTSKNSLTHHQSTRTHTMHNSKQVRRAASPALQSRQIHAPTSRDHSNNKLQQQKQPARALVLSHNRA